MTNTHTEDILGKEVVFKREKFRELIEHASSGTKEKAARELLDKILQFAHEERASDVHLEPNRELTKVRFRIDGILHDYFELQPELHERLVSLIKVSGRLRTDEHRVPQDGRLRFFSEQDGVDVRISIIPVEHGERVVLRLLSRSVRDFRLDDLGLSERDLKAVDKALNHSWGMLLSTGPTGSGKTTTIYAALQALNDRRINIGTIENPIEYSIDGVNQTQVDLGVGLTFADGLRSVLRQDPDVIMVGEIRDEETARIAINAALTGHRLLSTLHTNNAASAIARLMDRGIEPFLISSTLICVIAQRLVRRVCSDCWQSVAFSKEDARRILDEQTIKKMFEKNQCIAIAQATGCASCNQSGYRGRVGVFEVLEITPSIKECIMNKSPSDEIHALAKSEGMTTISNDAIRKVISLETSMQEFVRVMYE